MSEDERKLLQELHEDFLRIRKDKLLKTVTLNTMVGDFKISNLSVGNMVVDLLIRETREQIKKGVEDD